MSGYSDRPPDEFPVLAKPFTPSTLLNRIRAVLDS
jgi:hypothetical protein